MPEPNNASEDAQSEEFGDEWLFRPCSTYEEEFRDCTSIKARFHQYFVFGETLDCNQWKTDYKNCCKWQETKDKEAYNELVNSEKKRRLIRLKAHYDNDVWEKRDKPPEDWNAPLPKWLEERNKNSCLKEGNGKYSCIIM